MNVKMRIYEPGRLTVAQQISRKSEYCGKPLAFHIKEIMGLDRPMRAGDFLPFNFRSLNNLAIERNNLRILSPQGHIVPARDLAGKSISFIDEFANRLDSKEDLGEIFWKRNQEGWKVGNATVNFIIGDIANVNVVPFFSKNSPFTIWSGTGYDLIEGICEGIKNKLYFFSSILKQANESLAGRDIKDILADFNNKDFVLNNFLFPLTDVIFKRLELSNNAGNSSTNIPIVRFGSMDKVVKKVIQESTFQIGQGISNFLAAYPNARLREVTFSIYSDKDLIQKALKEIKPPSSMLN